MLLYLGLDFGSEPVFDHFWGDRALEGMEDLLSSIKARWGWGRGRYIIEAGQDKLGGIKHFLGWG